MSDPHDELQVVLLAQCGDPVALETLLLGVQSSLSRYISGLVGRQSAGDVLQEVFVKIWRNLEWLHRPELFRPWAYRIASRTCHEHLNRARRWSDRLDEAAVVEDLPAPTDCGIDSLAGLDSLFERVSPASRTVLLLHYVEDLSIEETAAILDISVGTAKSRLAYGLSCLREFTTSKGQVL
jgi:RNA polymerase sigma-70 factor (ECF subfamily)